MVWAAGAAGRSEYLRAPLAWDSDGAAGLGCNGLAHLGLLLVMLQPLTVSKWTYAREYG